MANAYNKPQSSEFMQTYVSQHVPVPMELYMKALAVRQDNQDKSVAAMDAISDANRKNQGVATADQEYIKNMNKTFDDTAEQLSNQDLNSADVHGQMKSLIKGVSRDENLYKIKQNQAKYQQFLENKSDMMKAGKDIAPASVYQFQKSLADYEAAGGYKSGKTLASPDLKEHIKVRPIQEEYFNNIPQSGSDSLFKIGETYGKTGWHGISSQLIHTRAGQEYLGYSKTSAAQQEREEYQMMKDQGALPKGKDGKPMGQEEYVFNNFLQAGLERVGGISTTNMDGVMNTENKRKKEAADYSQHLLLREADPRINGGIKPEFDEKGNLKGSGDGIFSDLMNGKLFNRTTHLNDEEATSWDKIRIYAHANKISDQQAYERFAKVQHVPVSTYTNQKTADKANKDLFNPALGSGAYKEMLVIDFENGGKPTNFTQYLKTKADEGKLLDKKGNVLTMSDNPTGQEMRNVMEAAGIAAIGETEPNYLTADGVALSIDGSTVILDRTYGGQYNKYVSQDKLDKKFADELSVYGSAIKNGKIYVQDAKTGQAKPYKAEPNARTNYHIDEHGRPVDH